MGSGHVSIVLLITFESSEVIVSRARSNLLIYFLFMGLRVQFKLMVVIVGWLCDLLRLVFIIIISRLMVLDNWLTLVICDRLVMMWLYCSFVVSVIIVKIKVILSCRDVLDPLLISDRRYAVFVLYMMWLPFTSILLRFRISVLHHGGLHLNIMTNSRILDHFSWMQV